MDELKSIGHTVAGLGHGPVNWGDAAPIDFWLSGDINAETLDVLADRVGAPDLMFNVAGGSSVAPSLMTPLGDYEKTVSSTMRMLNWIWQRSGHTRFISVSSAAVYGGGFHDPIAEDAPLKPISPYGLHKAMAETAIRYWAQEFGIEVAIVRPFSVYGPGLKKQLIYELCLRIMRGEDPLTLSGSGAEQRDWIEITDLVRVLTHVASFASVHAPTFNAGMGKGYTVRETVEELVNAFGAAASIRFDGQVRRHDPSYLVGSSAKLVASGFKFTRDLKCGFANLANSFDVRKL